MSFITIDTPIVAGDTVVSGTTDLPDGTFITAAVIGRDTANAAAAGGIWSVTFADPISGGSGIYATDSLGTYSTNHVLVKQSVPTINGPIDPSATAIGGTLSSSAVGTKITVIKNGTPIATTSTGDGGFWGASVAGLVVGDSITAKAGGNENVLQHPTCWFNSFAGMIGAHPHGGYSIVEGYPTLIGTRLDFRLDASFFFPDDGGFFVSAAPAPQPFLRGTLVVLSTGEAICFGGSPASPAFPGSGTGGSRVGFSLAQDGIAWTPYGTQSAAYYREGHFAFVLPGNSVFLVGGAAYSDPNFSAEDGVGDVTGEVLGGVVTANTMGAPEGSYAVLLNTGKILIGATGGGIAELYDPGPNTFTPAANPMTAVRSEPGAALLLSGNVLIAGGQALASAEIYDPVGDTFTATTGPMSTNRNEFTAVLLDSGKVLCAGGHDGANGVLATAELYDPVADTFSPTGSMSVPRLSYAAIKLADGTVLIAGGASSRSPLVYDATAEIYDPLTETFSMVSGSAQSASSGAVTVGLVDPADPPFPPGAAWAYGNKPL